MQEQLNLKPIQTVLKLKEIMIEEKEKAELKKEAKKESFK